VILVSWVGVKFAAFVSHFESLGATPYVPRPAGVEAFLPISALMSVKYWLETGIVHPVHPAGFVLFVVIVGMSLIVKKSFCSWVCPIGFLSESLARVGARIFGRNLRVPRWLDIPLRGLKYLLLGFFLWAILQMPAAAIGAFLDSPYNRVADVKMLKFFTDITPFALWTLVVLAVLSIPIRGAWCRYLCPYGGLLGLVSLASPWKVTRTPEACTDCGMCAQVCPSGLPVDRLLRVRSDECTGCVDCVRSCPVEGALDFALPSIAPEPRRRLSPVRVAALVLVLFFVPVGIAKLTGTWKTSVTDAEYRLRIPEIGSPLYQHAQGSAPRDPRFETNGGNFRPGRFDAADHSAGAAP
jgi:ferredoxin